MTPAIPKAAATIILVRPQNKQIQVYLLKRSTKARFMPGNYVFPGGMLDACDQEAATWSAMIDLPPQKVKMRFGGGLAVAAAQSFCIAAIRETFEEAGVLLAETGNENRLDVAQIRVDNDGFAPGWFLTVAKANHWRLRFSSLYPWAHWITPTAMKYRYDTRFFVALMPADQDCKPDQRETSTGVWIEPETALEANLAGKLVLSPPTLVTLDTLRQFADFDDLMAGLSTRTWGPTIKPRMVTLSSGAVLVEPWDAEFEKTEIEINENTLSQKVLPVGAGFSRIWLHKGVWRPVSP